PPQLHRRPSAANSHFTKTENVGGGPPPPRRTTGASRSIPVIAATFARAREDSQGSRRTPKAGKLIALCTLGVKGVASTVDASVSGPSRRRAAECISSAESATNTAADAAR